MILIYPFVERSSSTHNVSSVSVKKLKIDALNGVSLRDNLKLDSVGSFLPHYETTAEPGGNQV